METRADATQWQGAEITQTVFPACTCGHAVGAHRCQGWHPLVSPESNDDCRCMAYAPSKPVDEFTAFYRPWATTRGWRRTVCLGWWWIERHARTARQRVEKQV